MVHLKVSLIESINIQNMRSPKMQNPESNANFGSSEKVGWNVAVRTGVAEHPVTGFVVCMECYSEVSIKK